MSREKLNELEFGLANFTNSELYYIISTLLDAGKGLSCADPQRLYISQNALSANYTIVISFNFVLITGTSISIGTLDLDGDDIEVISYSHKDEDVGLTLRLSKSDSFNLLPLEDGYHLDEVKRIPNPYTFVQGIQRLISQPTIKQRARNTTFNLYPDSPIPTEFKQNWDLSTVKSVSGTNFSGDYFLIAKPVSENENHKMMVYNFKNTYNVEDDYQLYNPEQIEIIEESITSNSIKAFKLGRRSTITELHAEDIYKRKVPVEEITVPLKFSDVLNSQAIKNMTLKIKDLDYD